MLKLIFHGVCPENLPSYTPAGKESVPTWRSCYMGSGRGEGQSTYSHICYNQLFPYLLISVAFLPKLIIIRKTIY